MKENELGSCKINEERVVDLVGNLKGGGILRDVSVEDNIKLDVGKYAVN